MKSKWLLITTLAACGALKDNARPSRTHVQTQGLDSAGVSCVSLDPEKLSDDEFREALLCQGQRLDTVFDKAETAKKDELGTDEFRALANTFMLKDKPLTMAEVRGGQAIYRLLTGREGHTFARAELKGIFAWLGELAPSLRVMMSDPKTRDYKKTSSARTALLTSVFDRIVERAKPDDAFEEIEFQGLLELAAVRVTEFLKPEDLAAARPDVLFDAVTTFLGFSQAERSARHLPFGTLTKSSDFGVAYINAMKILSEGDYRDPSTLEQRDRFEKAMVGAFAKLLPLTGYAHGGFTRADLERVLRGLKASKLSWDGRPVELSYEPASFAERLLKVKDAFAGGGTAGLGADGLRRLWGELTHFAWDSSVWPPADINPHQALPETLREIYFQKDFWPYVELNWDRFVHSSQAWSAPSNQPTIESRFESWSAVNRYWKLRFLSAVVLAFDTNDNRVLEISRREPSNELKILLKTLTLTFHIGAKLSQDDRRAQTDETLKDSTRVQAASVDQVLDNPGTLGALVFVSDNLSWSGNSDGALNAAELADLLDMISRKTRLDRVFGPPEKKEQVADGASFMKSRLENSGEFSALSSAELDALALRMQKLELRVSYNLFSAYELIENPSPPDHLVGMALLLSGRSPETVRSASLAEWMRKYGADWINLLDVVQALPLEDATNGGTARALAAFFSTFEETLRQRTLFHSPERDLRFEDVEAFLKDRLSLASASFLDKRLQVLLLALPPDVARDTFLKLLWNADRLSQKIDREHKSLADLLGEAASLPKPSATATASPARWVAKTLGLARILSAGMAESAAADAKTKPKP